MPFIIPDDKVRWLLEQAEKRNTKEFNFGVVIERPGVTGSLVKEFVPVLKFTETELRKLYDDSELEHLDKNTLDMWNYFKEF